MANARHAKMLRVILGETLEQKRFFEQALAGRTDLLGRRGAAARAVARRGAAVAVDRVAAMADRYCAIALGSNLGDRRAHLDYAVVAPSRSLLDQPRASRAIYDTVPVGVVRSAARCS